MSTALNTYRPEGALKNLHVAGVIRTGLLFVLATLAACVVIALITTLFVQRAPPTKPGTSIPISAATTPPSSPVTSLHPYDSKQFASPQSPSEDSDADKIPVIA